RRYRAPIWVPTFFGQSRRYVHHALLWNGSTPFLETRAKEGTVAVTERVIQYGGRQSVVLHQKHGVPLGVRRCQFCARVLKGLRNIHDDRGLVLKDEN